MDTHLSPFVLVYIYDLALESHMNKGKWKCSRFTLSIYPPMLYGCTRIYTKPLQGIRAVLRAHIICDSQKIIQMPNYDILPWL